MLRRGTDAKSGARVDERTVVGWFKFRGTLPELSFCELTMSDEIENMNVKLNL